MLEPATLYFDLGSPYAYLACMRIDEAADPVRWQPVSLGALFKLNGRSSWAVGDGERRRTGMAEVERRARQYGLPPVEWPEPWPGNYLTAMRAAVFATRVGRGRQFAVTAFCNAFQRGHDLSLPECVWQAAEESGLDPAEVRRATEDDEIKLALRQATDRAHRLGVFGVPTVVAGGKLLWGDDRLEQAVRRLADA